MAVNQFSRSAATYYYYYYYYYYYCHHHHHYLWHCSPARAMVSSFTRFRDHTQRRATFVGLLWASDQLFAEISTWQHTQQTNIHAPSGIRTHDLSRRAAVDLRLRPHWDRLLLLFSVYGLIFSFLSFSSFTNFRYPFMFTHLKTNVRLLYLKTQSVPRSKHFSSRL
jgi:hypothetical protein